MPQKPIRVFWSEMSQRFYASIAYQKRNDGSYLITGQKFDVTDDIGHAITEHEITFTKKESEK